MLDKEVSDLENLYRGVPENQWNFDENRPSSAAFKDSWGTSVDRQGGRNDQDCVSRLLTEPKDFYFICKISSAKVRQLEAYIHYNGHEKSRSNIYHCEIHDSPGTVKIKNGKAKKLSKNTVTVYQRS